MLSIRCYLPLLGLVAASCAGPQIVDTGRVAIVTPETLPMPTEQDLTGVVRRHQIGPFDRLSVEVYGIAELSRTVQVDADGRISLPVAGTLDVNGKSPQEVSRIVAERLRAGYVRNPDVTVNLIETVSQVVTIDGEVETPGIYPVVGRMTLMRAVARAQGTTDFARTTHVVVFRTVDGRPMAALYDLRAVRLAAYADPEIYPNDVVVVGESSARRIFPQILQAGALLLTPLITFIDRN